MLVRAVGDDSSAAGGAPIATDRQRPPLWRELVAGLLVFGLYSLVTTLDYSGKRADAERHARDVYHFEQSLHLDPERALNSWLTQHDVLRVLANYEYALGYIVGAFVLIFWLWAKRPDAFRWARTSFLTVNLIGIACFALYPVAPPRMFPDLGFSDTVSMGHTWASWGSPLVSDANELAAMPSLHMAWAIWVSVCLARISKSWRTQLAGAVHVLLTLFVIMATANHFLLDAVAGAVVVAISSVVATALSGRPGVPRGQRVSAADAFFLHVESDAAPQHVGGLVLLDFAGRPDGAPTREDVAAVIRAQLDRLPRFRQQLSPPTRWRRARWTTVTELDWDWHVTLVDLSTPDGAPGGRAALNALVAEVQATPMPRNRPLWRMYVVHGVSEHEAAAIFVVHHVVADGFGTVAQALHLLEPPLPPRSAESDHPPGRVKSALATAAGLAQLATDGRPRGRLPTTATGERRFGTVIAPLADVRAIARARHVRVSDVLLTAVAGGLSRLLDGADSAPAQLRASVPLMVRAPGASIEGNVTAAVMLDLPIEPMAETDRLERIAARTGRLRRPTRALASRWVMDAVGESMPPGVHAWFARTVYGWRYFHAIVSNMPGPDVALSLAGAPIQDAFPILPLAPGAPLAIGALGWNGRLCLGISADPALIPAMDDYADAIRNTFQELSQDRASVSAIR